MISVAHAVLAAAIWALLWRGVTRQTFVGHAPDLQIASALAIAVLVAAAAGSVALVASGRTVWTPSRALALDVASYAAVAWALGILELGPWPRDLGGVFVVAIVVARLAPGAYAIVEGAPSWLALVVALGAYGALASWLPVASAPFGDQIDYLLDADRLRHGSLDATLDPALFTRILGVPPSPTDAATHVANTALGPRPIQGYAMGLLLLPGWALAGRLGAGIVMAVVGALASWQTLLLLRDLVARRIAAWTWIAATALLPASLLATHLYPNVVGALLVAAAFRAGFTAPARRPALAAALLALTLFLNPRDGLAVLTLGPFLLLRGPRRRVLVAGAAVALVAVAVNGLLYGIPVPYAGYLFGTAEAQAITRQPSIVPSFWIGLPAILFDRDLGLAGSAPWLFVGLLGLGAALRRDRDRLLPAAVTVGVGLAALSFFRLWEGGYAPPGRYFVDVLPLWTPFVAYGLAAALTKSLWDVAVRAFVVAAMGMSAFAAFVLNAAPALALNSAFDDKIRDVAARILGIDPLGWLPSFQPLTPAWYVTAYLALVPALAIVAAATWRGLRYR
ncbi:MAG: hypothetical protein KGK34_12250 [Chloroflexota bacterium]|nr:hypothetical protein [Chloroflexota bacterium]